jgi:hypothetical protein
MWSSPIAKTSRLLAAGPVDGRLKVEFRYNALLVIWVDCAGEK